MQGTSALPGEAGSLTRRELTVLEEVVATYLRTGEAVPSARVARSGRVALSPATVRQVMARLEERGLLRRPHPSAGRVPTDASLRLYVQLVRRRRGVPRRARHRLESGLRRHPEAYEDLGWLARLLAEVTDEAAMLVRPLGDEPLVEGVFLVPLGGRRALSVVVTVGGSVFRRAIQLEERLGADELREVANRLTEAGRGRPVGEVRAMLEEGSEDEDEEEGPLADRRVRRIGRQVFSRAGERVELVLVGAERLLDGPDFESVGQVRAFLEALADHERMAALLRSKLDEEKTRAIIGDESELTRSGSLGIVATVYFRAGRRAGALAVVGPRRMDYGAIVPIVEYVGRAVTEMLEEEGGADDARA